MPLFIIAAIIKISYQKHKVSSLQYLCQNDCNNKLVWLDLYMIWLDWSGLHSSCFAHAAASYDYALNQVHTNSFTGLVKFGFSLVGLVGAM